EGAKSIQRKDIECVVSGQVLHTFRVSLVVGTQRGASKRMSLRDFEKTTRARRGIMVLRELKSQPHRIRGFFVIDDEDTIHFRTANEEVHQIFPLTLTTSERTSNGSFVVDTDHVGEVLDVWKKVNYET